jgi:hypothetical protein
MSDTKEIFASVAAQLMNSDHVLLNGKRRRVERVGRGRFRMVQFGIDGRQFEAIEQNPEKPSLWGKMARKRHQVVQFRDLEAHRYVAVSVDGQVKEYGRQL